MNNELTVQGNKKRRIKSVAVKLIIITAALVVLMPVISELFIGLLFSLHTHYYIFTEKRTEKMEDIFYITVTDDIKLLHYEDSSILIDETRTLTLETSDYENFLNNNINAEIKEIHYDNASEDTLYYKYVNSRREVTVSPSKHKGKYIITIRQWA